MVNAYKANIIIVDDEPIIRKEIQRILAKGGYELIYLAASGEEALKIINEHPDIQIVITDLVMEGMDGLDLIKLIKEIYPHIEIILQTGYGSQKTIKAAYELGVFTYLMKPIDSFDLISALDRCTEKIGTNNLLANLTGQIFLSYAREDVNRVEDLYVRLQRTSFLPWMDTKDIAPGEVWEDSIERAIRQSDFFLACLSRSSVNKRGMIQKELRIAFDVMDSLLECDIFLIPVRFEECVVPERLCKKQWVDIFAGNGWESLIGGLRKGLALRAESLRREKMK